MNDRLEVEDDMDDDMWSETIEKKELHLIPSIYSCQNEDSRGRRKANWPRSISGFFGPVNSSEMGDQRLEPEE